MFVISFSIVIILFLLISFSINKKYYSILFFYICSTAILIFLAAVYISKISYYHFPLRIDYLIYLKLTKVPLSTLRISRYYNWGIAFFMFSSLYCARQTIDLKIKPTLLLSLPIAAYIIYTEPVVMRKVDITKYLINPKWLPLYTNACKALDIIFLIIIFFYTCFSFYCIYEHHQKTKYVIRKFHIKILAGCILLVDIFFYTIIVFGPFNGIMFYNVNPVGLPNNPITFKAYIFVPCAALIILLFTIILLFVYKPFNMFYFAYNQKRDIKRNTQLLTQNISADMHVYKNIFWSMSQQFELIKLAMDNNDHEAISEYADNGLDIINQQLTQMQGTLNLLYNDYSAIEDINIIKCIDNAIEKASYSSRKVTFIKDYEVTEVISMGNEYVLTETFLNLIKNAIESFEKKPNVEPMITIRIQLEYHTCMIEISDNGCGIPNSELKNIFEPFYSTKIRTKNSGVGLHFVKNVINAYHGTIEVISKVNQYTTFQITLPISTKKRKNK